MRFRTKFILVIITVLAAWFFFSRTFETLKEKYFYKFIANRFHAYAEKRWNADLYIGYVKGSIFKDLSLGNIVVGDIKNLPKGLEIKADSLNLTYPPFGLLLGKFDAKFENLSITYKDVAIPVDAYQRGELAVIIVRNNTINLDKFSGTLPQGILLRGTMSMEGEVILKKLKPHLVNISFNSKDFRLDYESSRKTGGSLKIEIAGKADNLRISGDIKVNRTNFDGGSSFFSLEKARKSGNGFLHKAFYDITEETNVGRYKIYAKIEGSGNMRLTLSSQPELPYSEIASLIIFGKMAGSLTTQEKDRLTQADFNDILISNLFSF